MSGQWSGVAREPRMGISYTSLEMAERDDSNLQEGKGHFIYSLGLILGQRGVRFICPRPQILGLWKHGYSGNSYIEALDTALARHHRGGVIFI